MQIVATYDFHFGLRDKAEVLQRGDHFTPPGTGVMNAAEHARSLISRGAAVTPEQWAKRKPEGDNGAAWAKAEVDRLNAAK